MTKNMRRGDRFSPGRGNVNDDSNHRSRVAKIALARSDTHD